MSRYAWILRDSFAKQGAFPQEYRSYFKGKQRSLTEKDREMHAFRTRVFTL